MAKGSDETNQRGPGSSCRARRAVPPPTYHPTPQAHSIAASRPAVPWAGICLSRPTPGGGFSRRTCAPSNPVTTRNEDLPISYKTLRDHAFSVTGGEVKRARRLERGKNIRWQIRVRPDSSADVTIVLPVTEDCTAQGAVCTEDGRMLSTRLELTVSGP